MIYRGWSLITGPAVMVGGVAGALFALDYLVKQVSFSLNPSFLLFLFVLIRFLDLCCCIRSITYGGYLTHLGFSYLLF